MAFSTVCSVVVDDWVARLAINAVCAVVQNLRLLRKFRL